MKASKILTRLLRKVQHKKSLRGGDGLESGDQRANLGKLTGAADKADDEPLPEGERFAAGPMARFNIAKK